MHWKLFVEFFCNSYKIFTCKITLSMLLTILISGCHHSMLLLTLEISISIGQFSR